MTYIAYIVSVGGLYSLR